MITRKDKNLLEQWNALRDNIAKDTSIDFNETAAQKANRMQRLEANDEEWFKFYFPTFYKSDPAPFHLRATKRVMNNPEFFEVRAWSRELAKSARTMMEVMKLALTGKKENILMVSATKDDAERLLLPYKSNFEKNQRIINDYGEQENFGIWAGDEFVTKKGVSFRAIGAGQSPRGTRKDEKRPDVILIDDIDTDQEVRNKRLIQNKVDWCMEALYATRSISEPMLLIVCGNIIGKYTTVTELGKRADHFEIVNIRDKEGKSTWPSKNTEDFIDRTLSKISYRSAQKEYFNNPMKEGTVFKSLVYGQAPELKKCRKVVVYADPSISNKESDKSNASHKCVIVVGELESRYYIYWIRLEQCGNAKFVDWFYDAYDFLVKKEVDVKRIWIENNSLQDSFYDQVIYPEIRKRISTRKVSLPISKDTRKKPEKFYRIEGTLEPIHRNGELIFSEHLKGTPDMERMEEQMLDVSPLSKTMDGPDALEGAVHKLKEYDDVVQNTYIVGKRTKFR